MPTPTTTEPIALPLPLMGYNCRDSLNAMGQEYSQVCKNWDIEPQHMRIRYGYVLHQTISGVNAIIALGSYGSNLFAFVDVDGTNYAIYNVTAAPSVAVASYAGAAGTYKYVYAHRYGTRLGFFADETSAADSRGYNGTVWAAPGFTYGGNPISAMVVAQYRDVVYLFATDGYVYYGATSAVTGATTRVSFQTIFKESNRLVWAGVLTTPSNRAIDTLLAFGNSEGEVLVYGGANPGAADWGLVARFQVGKPFNYNSAIEFDNDVFVLTESGIVSIRRLLDAGDDSISLTTISSQIDPYIARLARQIQLVSSSTFTGLSDTARASIAAARDRNRIFFYIRGSLTSDFYTQPNSATVYTSSEDSILVYNTITKSWAIHIVSAMIGSQTDYNPTIFYFAGDLYYACDNKVVKYSSSLFVDQLANGSYQSYAAQLSGAYFGLENVNRNKNLTGVELVCHTDLSSTDLVGGTIAVAVASDFGRKVSNYNFAPTIPSGYNQVVFSAGVRGTYLQYRLLVTSTSSLAVEGFKLYGIGVIVK